MILDNPYVLFGWVLLALLCVAVVARDLYRHNQALPGLMKGVWLLTVLYSGPLGLWVYWHTGRTQIRRDSVWRRGFRSVAHCYSGCGAGEVVGVFIAVGLLALGNLYVAAITFSLAYVFGYAMTLGPLLQEGVPMKTALKDTVIAETASIGVMEITAISIDIWLAGDATMAEPRFWSSLIVSLTAGLLVAYPVNVALIHWGVKEGMMDPREMRT